ncbi:MAG: DUF4391 domain-containing protein [Acidobacteriia bacterium]|nr:DUF4391 domain-containing protein [Terriglobia bacterium]
MTIDNVIAALDLPAGARVNRRVPKKLLVEHGAPTAADKRRINDGIEDVQWLAALKPTTIGVPEFRDTAREYLEIAVLSVALRSGAQAGRLAELIHRAVPYPVFLIVSEGYQLAISLAHKRWSHGETGATVLDGDAVAADLGTGQDGGFGQAFVDALPIARQPRANLFALYQGWMDTILALLAARVTGTFATAGSPEHAAARRSALVDCARLDAQIAGLRAAAAKETQLARRVELNLELKRMQVEYSAVRAKL